VLAEGRVGEQPVLDDGAHTKPVHDLARHDAVGGPNLLGLKAALLAEVADFVGVASVLVWSQVLELLAVVHTHVHLQDTNSRGNSSVCERCRSQHLNSMKLKIMWLRP
jgi:hypothetical protein